MALTINQNITALNAYRNLSTTQNKLSTSLERLSSGVRINRAADDAAGLAISEGLRSQVGGLKVAARNAQDGISVVQTAEGALTEVHSILQRLRDLAVQGGNDSNSADARSNIQTEANSLISELGRIAESTNFNGTKLLDGTAGGAGDGKLVFQVGAAGEESSTITVDLSSANVSDVAAALTPTAYSTGTVGTATSTSFTVNGEEVTFTAGASAEDINTAIQGVFGATTDITAAVDGDGNITLASTATALDSVSDSAGASVAVTATGGFSVTDNTAAQATIKALDAQIGKISTARANLGAYQNRFDHTINSVNVTMENLSASESRIRDTDMASEMVSFTNAQILSQAGTAMLAQANSIPQTVLQLLQ
ncbi:flagellin [Schaalia naturae]|uniref:Flagellin n=1 Tax=Schaalia naturae TaxID=635203 RepID=A0ABW2SM43_9ACTO